MLGDVLDEIVGLLGGEAVARFLAAGTEAEDDQGAALEVVRVLEPLEEPGLGLGIGGVDQELPVPLGLCLGSVNGIGSWWALSSISSVSPTIGSPRHPRRRSCRRPAARPGT